MITQAAGFYRDRLRPQIRQTKAEGAKWLLRHSVIFARLYEQSQRQKGWFFAMKAKLARFYRDKIEPKIAALKAKARQVKAAVTGRWSAVNAKVTALKQQVSQWLARHQHRLGVTALVTTTLVVIALLVYLWQRSPAFRATVKTLGVAIVSVLITLWALLKGLGLTLGEGLSGLGRGLVSLGVSMLNVLAWLWVRLTQPIINVIVVTRPVGDTVPVPPIDGRL
jgi:hypothetical protein